jgi:hypothetical protein
VVRWLAVAIGLGLLVGGITAATADQSPAQPSAASGTDFGPDGPGPSDTPDPALSGQPVPTLPPGDPGTDEPGTDDPDGGGGSDDPGSGPDDDDDASDADRPDAARLTEVPASALLDAQTVGAVTGAVWSAAGGADGTGADDACVAADQGAAPTRAAVLVADDGSGRLVQSVATWPTARAARTAVLGVGSALEACGFTAAGDPRLGEASAAFDRTVDGTQQHAVVIAVEGATLVLAGSGTAAEPGVWESLADVAMGSLCAAGVDGCH